MVSLLILLNSSSSSEVRVLALLLGPVTAVMFFTHIWRRYRNTDKSYQYEHTTAMRLSNVTGKDQRVGHIRRTRDPLVRGYERTKNPRDRIR